MKFSPIKNPSNPNSFNSFNSFGLDNPLSEIFIKSMGIYFIKFLLVCMSTLKVFKFLLFTPIMSIESIKHPFNSSKLWISIRTSKPMLLAHSLKLFIFLIERQAAINNIASAP